MSVFCAGMPRLQASFSCSRVAEGRRAALRICGGVAGSQGRARGWSAGAPSPPGRRRSASCTACTGSPTRENRRARPDQWWATDRSARHRSTSARFNFRTAACRPAGSALHPWPASRLTAWPICWPSHAPYRVLCSESFDRRPVGPYRSIRPPSTNSSAPVV
jgi:hypothetical protein